LTLIELIWTITPAVILILIAFPSFKLLYLMDEVSDPSMSVLAEGNKNDGPKPYILNKIVNTFIGQKKMMYLIMVSITFRYVHFIIE
jgi:heme/copper-type cytochrome/quinol oxidase subunit 2